MPEPVEPSRAPAGVLGAPVPMQVVIVHTDDLAVSLSGFAAQPAGAEMALTVRSAGDDSPVGDAQALGMEIGFADGRVAGTVGTLAREHRTSATVELVGRYDAPGRTDLRFWLSPLPPRGRLTVTLAWPERDIAPTRVVVDGGPLVEAANRAQVLW